MDKKYYWLKLDRNFFKRHDIQIIESMPNGKDYILFYLKLLVESIDHEGSLRFNDTIPYNDQMLSTITRTNIDIVRSAISIFKELELMEVLDDQTIYLTETTKMLGESTSTHRVQKYRETKKLIENDVKRYGNVTETVNETEIEKDKEIDIEKESITSNTKESVSLSSFINTSFKNFSNGNKELLNTLNDYKTMRTKIKKPLTDKAATLFLKKLDDLTKDQSTQILILEQSILNSWQGIFPLKEQHQQKSTKTHGVIL